MLGRKEAGRRTLAVPQEHHGRILDDARTCRGQPSQERPHAGWIAAALCMVALIILAPVLFDLDRYQPEVVFLLWEKTGKLLEIRHRVLTLFPSQPICLDNLGSVSPRGLSSRLFRLGRGESPPGTLGQ